MIDRQQDKIDRFQNTIKINSFICVNTMIKTQLVRISASFPFCKTNKFPKLKIKYLVRQHSKIKIPFIHELNQSHREK